MIFYEYVNIGGRTALEISRSIDNMEVKKIENSQVKLTFDVTKDEFEVALTKAFEKKNSEVTIKGFRKGHAPRSAFEKTYGVESLFAEALDFILNDKVNEVLKDQELCKDFIGKFEPLIEEKIERNKDFKVSLVIDTYPEVKLPEYKGIEVVEKNLEVTDKDVQNAIDALTRKDSKMEVKKEQVIASGDYAKFDFVGSVDGVEFPGGAANDYELQIGSGQFIPGFEDQMIGMKANETKDLNVTFPENYGQADLAGKAAVFKVTVKEVKTQINPELTDDYVKALNVAGATNLKELKEVKKNELLEAKKNSERDRQFDEVVNKILDSADIVLPRTLIQERVDQFKGQYEQQAKMYNIPFEKFVELMGATLKQFNDQAEKQARRQVLFNVIATKIIEEEKLAPKQEELEARAEADSKTNNKTKEQNLQENYARYYSDLAYKALVDLLLTNAKEVKEAKPAAKKATTKKAEATEEKPAAKKTTAKKATAAKEDAEKKPAAKKTTTARKTTTAKADAEKKPAAKKTTTKKATTKAE